MEEKAEAKTALLPKSQVRRIWLMGAAYTIGSCCLVVPFMGIVHTTLRTRYGFSELSSNLAETLLSVVYMIVFTCGMAWLVKREARPK